MNGEPRSWYDGGPHGRPGVHGQRAFVGMRWRVLGAISILVVLLVVGLGSDVLATRISPAQSTALAARYDSAFAGVPAQSANPPAQLPAQSATAAPSVSTGSAPNSCDCMPSRTDQVINSLPDPAATGQEIEVSVAKQWLYAYQDGKEVFDAPIATGRPNLPTPPGTYTIIYMAQNITFTSPFPPGSPDWYYPTHINYAMEFKDGGYFLHDAWWRESFGPGANYPHQNPDGTWENGTHGCVGMTIANAEWLYNWAHVGTTVVVA